MGMHYFEDGKRALHDGNKEKAQKLYIEAIKRDPQNEKYWVGLSEIIDEPQYLEKCLQKIISINPTNQIALRRLAELDRINKNALNDILPTEKKLELPHSSNSNKINPIPQKKKIPALLVITLALVAISTIIVGGIFIGKNILPKINININQATNETSNLPKSSYIQPTLNIINSIPTLSSLPTNPFIQPTTNPNSSGSYNSPIPLGQGYRFPGLGTLTVLDSLWSPGSTGYANILLSFYCERPSDQTCETGYFMLEAFGNSGKGYKQGFDQSIPEPSFGNFMNPDLHGGVSETGYVGFLVTEYETGLIMKVARLFETDKPDIYFQISK